MLAPSLGHSAHGAAATALGQVEAVLGRLDDADAHFGAGIEIEEGLGYDAFAARSRFWWAQMLRSRGRADDLRRAADLLGQAAATARRCGLGALLRDIDLAS
jgi:hypothetical protein